jgi:CRISPR-associated endonuclease Cas2
MSYLIIYDIRRLDNATRLRVNRYLRKLGALKLQHSVWEFNSFTHLRALAISIKSTGGRAIVMKKRVAYE